MLSKIYNDDCIHFLNKYSERKFDLTFLDPPFNQAKKYRNHNDNMVQQKYWDWMKKLCELTYKHSSNGSAIYFMQREKNTEFVLNALESTGWVFQNLIIWKKKTSAVPSNIRYGKHYQIIAYATKGSSPRVFNKLRIDPPLLETEKYRRPNGIYITDVWDDIREMTSGYLAGNEPLRDKNGKRIHNQQSPVHLLMRIILSSTNINDTVFDPFSGTGTTLVVAKQLLRDSIGTEIDPINVENILKRINKLRASDDINIHRNYYRFTENLDTIWPSRDKIEEVFQEVDQLKMF
jgi:site-specific DNA-methyltransferase (adenine-specific)